jgi:hypothetical protein
VDKYQEIVHDLLVYPYRFDVELVGVDNDWKKFRHARMYLERLRRDPNSHYRDRIDKELQALPKSEDREKKRAALDSVGWSQDTWKLTEISNELKSLKHIVLQVTGNKNPAPEPSLTPFMDETQSSGPAQGLGGGQKKSVHRSYQGAGKVIRLADMDEEFFAQNDTSY